MLCEPCRELTLRSLHDKAPKDPPNLRDGQDLEGYIILHQSFGDLSASAQNGCSSCSYYLECFTDCYGNLEELSEIVEQLEEEVQVAPVIAYLGVTYLSGVAENDTIRAISFLSLQIGTQQRRVDDKKRLHIDFRISQPRDAASDSSFKDLEFRFTEIDHCLGSDANFQIARDWIESCCHDHDPAICPPISDEDLPTRVIDVGAADGSEEPRLLVTSTGQRGRYLALSHCWGAQVKGERVITTKQNLESRERQIPMSILPANFHDAVVATRKLGFRFLWIDSLCIIQDSEEDWEAESAKMGDLYSKAALTIAAAAANDSDGGMFETHYEQKSLEDLQAVKWFRQNYKKTNLYSLNPSVSTTRQRSPIRMKVRGGDDSPSATLSLWSEESGMEETWYRCVLHGPLAFRGWTLQERLLSVRSLYYGSRQIYWQCPSTRRSAEGEMVPDWAHWSPANMGNDPTQWPNILGLRSLDLGRYPEDITKIHRTWAAVLEMYVKRRLTRHTDILPALSGMAAVIHDISKDDYIAGCWRKELLPNLVWTTIPSWAKGQTKLDYTGAKPPWESDDPPSQEGPSWSWMSAGLREKLTIYGTDKVQVWKSKNAEIVAIDLALHGRNPFGRVEKGTITLRGFTYDKWDGRVEGWNPPDSRIWGRLPDFISFYTCYHSWNYDEGVDTRWDYNPRHGMSWFPRKLPLLLLHLLLSLLAVLFYRGAEAESRLKVAHDKTCPYCVRHLCLHVVALHLVSAIREAKEVELFSLILEPVEGERDTYRRIGIVNKTVFVSPAELEDVIAGKGDPPVPDCFAEWGVQTVNII